MRKLFGDKRRIVKGIRIESGDHLHQELNHSNLFYLDGEFAEMLLIPHVLVSFLHFIEFEDLVIHNWLDLIRFNRSILLSLSVLLLKRLLHMEMNLPSPQIATYYQPKSP